MSKDSSPSGDDFFTVHRELVKKVGGVLTKWIPGDKGLGFFGSFIKGGKDTEQKELLATLENFLRLLEKTATILEKYTDEQKNQSPLTAEVKQNMQACYEWATLIEKKTPPEDLLKKLKLKADSLNTAISLENLRFGAQTSQEVEKLTRLTLVGIKAPLEYYEDGKAYVAQKRWNEAKNSFLSYRQYVLDGLENKLPAGTKLKEAHVDNHLGYLEMCQNELNKLMDSNKGMILSYQQGTAAPTEPENPYVKMKEDWLKKYSKK